MRRAFQRLLVSALLSSAPIVAPAVAHAAGDSTAIAINTKDGSSIFRLAFGVRRVMSDVVDQSNAAVAYASCEECQTVAVSVQLVLVMSDPDVVTPTNIAIAINEGCASCETLASAYQYVLTTDGPVHFDAEGNQELSAIKRDLRDLVTRSEDLEIEAIQTEVDALVARMFVVVDDHLISAGRAQDEDVGPESGEPTPTPVPESSQTPTDATTPEEGQTPSPSDTPGGSGSPGPESGQPTPEPTATP
jgi:putative peptide zinc metalloprotease protein